MTVSKAVARAWTDADGASSSAELHGSEIFTIEALRELTELVAALKSRR